MLESGWEGVGLARRRRDDSNVTQPTWAAPLSAVRPKTGQLCFQFSLHKCLLLIQFDFDKLKGMQKPKMQMEQRQHFVSWNCCLPSHGPPHPLQSESWSLAKQSSDEWRESVALFLSRLAAARNNSCWISHCDVCVCPVVCPSMDTPSPKCDFLQFWAPKFCFVFFFFTFAFLPFLNVSCHFKYFSYSAQKFFSPPKKIYTLYSQVWVKQGATQCHQAIKFFLSQDCASGFVTKRDAVSCVPCLTRMDPLRMTLMVMEPSAAEPSTSHRGYVAPTGGRTSTMVRFLSVKYIESESYLVPRQLPRKSVNTENQS